MDNEDKTTEKDETRFNSLNAHEFSQIIKSFQVMKKFISDILISNSSNTEELEQLEVAVQDLERTLMSSRLEFKQDQLFPQHLQHAALGHDKRQILEPQVNHSTVENQISNPFSSTRMFSEILTEGFKEQPDKEIQHSNDKFNLNSTEQLQVTEAIENLRGSFHLSSAQDIIQKLQLVVNSHSERPFEPREINPTLTPNTLLSPESQVGKFKIHRNRRSNRSKSSLVNKRRERVMKKICNQRRREMELEKVYETRWNWRGNQN